MNGTLFRQIEALFGDGRDEDALTLFQRLAFDVQLEWEQQSRVVRSGLQRTSWWERLFATKHPVTYQRLKKNRGRRSNAQTLLAQIRIDPDQHRNVWKGLLVLMRTTDSEHQGVWNADGHQVAIQVADEFGVDDVHLVQGTDKILRTVRFQREGMTHRDTETDLSALFSPSDDSRPVMMPVQAWTVPFQDAVVLVLQNRKSGLFEVVWAPTHPLVGGPIDFSFFALNHNTMAEDPFDFRMPPFLLGDESLGQSEQPILVTGIEGRTDLANVNTAVAAITLRQRDVLQFDQVKQERQQVRHWRQLVTDELFEPRRIPVSAMCYVLDGLLLYASRDGVLRAHPRVNPRSVYHVEDMDTLVSQMTSLYNVVALIHSHHVLQVRLVARKAEDPYISFSKVLFETRDADQSHAPLLYGPYCVYKALDGNFYRVEYDNNAKTSKQLIKVPFKAGYQCVSIKAANFRYMVVVLRNPVTRLLEDYFLFSGNVDNTTIKPFLVAACIECGSRATHLCRSCLDVAYCGDHIRQ